IELVFADAVGVDHEVEVLAELRNASGGRDCAHLDGCRSLQERHESAAGRAYETADTEIAGNGGEGAINKTDLQSDRTHDDEARDHRHGDQAALRRALERWRRGPREAVRADDAHVLLEPQPLG